LKLRRREAIMEFFIVEVYDAAGNFLGYHTGRGSNYNASLQRAKFYPKKGFAKSAVTLHYGLDYEGNSKGFVTKIIRYTAVRAEE
jgi:hypothetical protein